MKEPLENSLEDLRDAWDVFAYELAKETAKIIMVPVRLVRWIRGGPPDDLE